MLRLIGRLPRARSGLVAPAVGVRSFHVAAAVRPRGARLNATAAWFGGAAVGLSGAVAACSAATAQRELQGECTIVCEATCREEAAMDSPPCSFTLAGGTVVEVVKSTDVVDSRGRTRRRMCVRNGEHTGWISEVAGQGIRLITKPVPPSATPTATIRMYTTQRCPWCTRAKELLAAKGWSALVEELDPSTDEEAFRVMQRETGKNTVPQIFLVWSNGQKPVHIGGYDVLAEWDKTGKLDELLQQAAGSPNGSKKGWFGL